MSLVDQHTQAPGTTVKAACDAMGVSRATYYRRKKAAASEKKTDSPRRHPRKLSPEERRHVLEVLCSKEFADLAPSQVFPKLLERGQYLCSIRTMYRILKENNAVKERRKQRRHPLYAKPSLTADGPNQVWTWDITKIPGPRKGVVYCLYVALDLYSRRVVAWTLAATETSAIAQRMFRHAVASQGIDATQLTIHADRGAPMTSHGLYALFECLGITGSHSRPRVSNDNAFSEAQFKTLKYRPKYPGRFESIQAAEAYFVDFFDRYNQDHHHTGIGLFTPDQVHSGEHLRIQNVRQAAMDQAFERNPERFVHGRPTPPQVPETVSINPETTTNVAGLHPANPSSTIQMTA